MHLLFAALLVADADAEFFSQKVQPVLEARCFKCHGAEKSRGGLRLDSRDAVAKGGSSGPALPLVIKAITHKDADLEMPPDEKLPDGEIAILTRWVEQGAPWPASAVVAKHTGRKEKVITDKDRSWWSYRPVVDPPVPRAGRGWARNEIDRFVAAKLAEARLRPAPAADRATVLRRLTFDLHGLPPAPQEVEAFVRDSAPDAYERAVDRLLASPRYGERWGRYWLDVVHYAESDGHRQDAFRPNAWPYRDWVIRSLNEDKPYDRFVSEQLAGDELAPEDPEVFVATGFLRLGTYEWNQRDVRTQWGNILNELTDLVGDAFLGMGMACARCHDHKFDPILQRDYYRMQAFLAPIAWREDRFLATAVEETQYRAALTVWEQKTAPVRAEIAAVEHKYLESADATALDRFPLDIRALILKPVPQRTPFEHQIADLAFRQVLTERAKIDGAVSGADRARWVALKRKLGAFEAERPRPPPTAFVATDVGPVAPPTFIPAKGEARQVEPGFPTVLGPTAAAIVPPDGGVSTGRRTALARWLTSAENPLTARVMVNRMWQQHFGRGLVATSSDFGRLGEKPSHPELLDWLTSSFIRNGWSLKRLHRLMVTSAAYRQSSRSPLAARAHLRDPENRLLWRMSRHRLDAEQVRDALLATSGELNVAAGGPSVEPTEPRRSIYTRVLRNTRDPLLGAFDPADPFASTSSRNVTTTASQALLLVNGRWPLGRAETMAATLAASAHSREDRLVGAFRRAFGRPPHTDERRVVDRLLTGVQPGTASEDVAVEAMPHRGGKAIRVRAGEIGDRLRLAVPLGLPSDQIAVEAVVLLDSLAEDARGTRVIAAQWPGWSLAVTAEKSKQGAGNVILELAGRVIASDLHIELHRTYQVSLSTTADEATFQVRDLSDPDAPLRTATVKHKPIAFVSTTPLVIGGRAAEANHGWDGLVDEVRISTHALWQFETAPGTLADGAGKQAPLAPLSGHGDASTPAWLVDLCHVLLNSNEFIHVD